VDVIIHDDECEEGVPQRVEVQRCPRHDIPFTGCQTRLLRRQAPRDKVRRDRLFDAPVREMMSVEAGHVPDIRHRPYRPDSSCFTVFGSVGWQIVTLPGSSHSAVPANCTSRPGVPPVCGAEGVPSVPGASGTRWANGRDQRGASGTLANESDLRAPAWAGAKGYTDSYLPAVRRGVRHVSGARRRSHGSFPPTPSRPARRRSHFQPEAS
jgi:hypothetical protein